MKSIIVVLSIGFCVVFEIVTLLICQYLYSYGPEWIMIEGHNGEQMIGFATGMSMFVACLFPIFLAFAICVGIADINFKENK